MAKQGIVYILASPNRNTLYIGVTSDLPARIHEHKSKLHPNSFSARYNCIMLVYYSIHQDMYSAITEEKRLKGYNRKYKEQLIDTMNPEWKDLSEDIY
jgi:putative endonuclease